MAKEEEYVPFGPEWKKEMMKWSKSDLVEWMKEKMMAALWIPCDERQPEKPDEYNVVWQLDDEDTPVVTTMAWTPEKTWNDKALGGGTDYTDKIIRWQPLPKYP